MKTADRKVKKGKFRDKTMYIVVFIVLLILGVIMGYIAAPIINKTKYESYINDLTRVINDSRELEEPIIAVMNGNEYILDDYAVSEFYSKINIIGMGMKQGGAVGEETLSIKFYDGTTLEFKSGEVMQGARKGRMMLYIYFTGSNGKKYNYSSDMFNYKSMSDVVEEMLKYQN